MSLVCHLRCFFNILFLSPLWSWFLVCLTQSICSLCVLRTHGPSPSLMVSHTISTERMLGGYGVGNHYGKAITSSWNHLKRSFSNLKTIVLERPFSTSFFRGCEALPLWESSIPKYETLIELINEFLQTNRRILFGLICVGNNMHTNMLTYLFAL